MRKMQRKTGWLALPAALLTTTATFPARAADPIADFYHGKTVRIIVGFGVGDGFDIYARLLSRFLPAHLSGEPTIIVQNMPGAGSLVALNYVNHAAPHDGTVIGMVNPVTTVQHKLQPEVANFDPLKLNWLGSMTTDYYNCGFWTDKPMTLADLQSKHFIVGSTATTGGTYAGDRVFEAVLHLDFKIVPGYTNLGELRQASERGEVQGFCGVMAMTLKSTFWPTYQAKQLQIPVRANLAPDPDMPDVPNAFDLVKSEEDRQLLMLLAGPWYFGRPFMAPPNVPAPRLAALREAFAATLADSALLAEAKNENLEIHPLSAEQIVDTIKKIDDISPSVIERAKPMFGVGAQ
jgi:tripartite-type tricarboxylate transporter receptor subunit TctC